MRDFLSWRITLLCILVELAGVGLRSRGLPRLVERDMSFALFFVQELLSKTAVMSVGNCDLLVQLLKVQGTVNTQASKFSQLPRAPHNNIR